MHQVGPAEGGHQAGEGRFGRGLLVKGDCIGAAGRAEYRQVEFVAHLGQRGRPEAHLRRAVGDQGGGHIQHGGHAAKDNRRPPSLELGHHQPAQGFGHASHQVAGSRHRGGTPRQRHRSVNHRDAFLHAVEQLGDSLIGVGQRGERLGIVNIVRPLGQRLPTAHHNGRHLGNCHQAAEIARAVHQRLGAVHHRVLVAQADGNLPGNVAVDRREGDHVNMRQRVAQHRAQPGVIPHA